MSSDTVTQILKLIPAGDSTAWITPWVTKVLGDVKPDENPYTRAIDVIRDVYYPSVVGGFKPQLWFLMGLFGVYVLFFPPFSPPLATT
jgi:hypothetical protein